MRELSSLIRAVQSGDQDAFVELVERFQGMAIGMVKGRLPDSALALDVVQEAWIDAYFSLPTLRLPVAFSAWFRRILIKHVDRHVRQHQVSLTSLASATTWPSSQADGLEMLLHREQQEGLRKAVDHLPPPLREVVHGFYEVELSQRMIADHLSVPLTTVKKRLYLARQWLGVALLMPELDLPVVLPHPLSKWTVPFWLALWAGDADRIQQLLRLDPTLVQQREQPVVALTQCVWLDLTPGFTPLHRAVAYHDRVLVQILLAAQADCNAVTPAGITPLHVAVLTNAIDLVQMLLTAGAIVNAPTLAGMTPLHWAAQRGHTKLTSLLGAAGAFSQVRDRYGQTPLQWERQTTTRIPPLQRRRSRSFSAALGRVVGPDGIPLDGHGPFPPVSQRTCSGASSEHHSILEMGIKALDLFAPLPRSGIVSVQAAAGVGQLVFLCELIYRLVHRYQGCAVVVCYAEHAVASHRFVHEVRSSGLTQDVTLMLCPRQASPAEQARCVAYGHDLAMALAAEQEVFLMVEQGLLHSAPAWHVLKQRSATRMTTLLYSADTPAPASPSARQCDGHIVLHPNLARQGIYPAFDLHTSSSYLLHERTLSPLHQALVPDIRQMLTPQRQRADPRRSQRLQWFQTQPFFVAAPFTARMGQDVGLATTLHDYATILAGSLDTLPLAAFHFIGSMAGAEQ